MEKQEQTSEEEEEYEATLFESVYGKDWKAIIANIRGLSGLTTDTSNTVVPQPGGNQNTVQSDAGKGEDIIDASHIGVHERESNVHTEQSDAGKDKDLSEHDVKQIA